MGTASAAGDGGHCHHQQEAAADDGSNARPCEELPGLGPRVEGPDPQVDHRQHEERGDRHGQERQPNRRGPAGSKRPGEALDCGDRGHEARS